MRKFFLLLGFLLLSCGHESPYGRNAEITISRSLERAIELGEKYLADRELIENVARTEGTEAAARRYDELNHRANYEEFWACLEESDSIWRDVPDTLERRVIRAKMMPYLERLTEMADEIVP
jgi:hypothetical protein